MKVNELIEYLDCSRRWSKKCMKVSSEEGFDKAASNFRGRIEMIDAVLGFIKRRYSVTKLKQGGKK